MTAEPVDAVIKTCGCCGRAFDADTWAALPLCGYVGDEEVLELRHCECKSTISVEVKQPAREAA
jgi:hypothetical protein